jgi:hypothetical protein
MQADLRFDLCCNTKAIAPEAGSGKSMKPTQGKNAFFLRPYRFQTDSGPGMCVSERAACVSPSMTAPDFWNLDWYGDWGQVSASALKAVWY